MLDISGRSPTECSLGRGREPGGREASSEPSKPVAAPSSLTDDLLQTRGPLCLHLEGPTGAAGLFS